MPSTTSSSLSRPEPSSTVITPSLPTLSIASAMSLPISSSPFAAIVPTCAIDLLSADGLLSFLSSSTADVTALSMPRLRSIGFMPAATALRPSRISACASTVAVVVPSPATSEVLEATSLTICAPMFSNLSASSISFATDTPSLVIVGAPKLFSSTTLRPFGPRVALTALARVLTPRSMRARASSEKRISLAAIWSSGIRDSGFGIGGSSGNCRESRAGSERFGSYESRIPNPQSLLLDDRNQVFFAHDQQFVAVDLDLGAGVLAEQHDVAGLDRHRADLA